MKLQHEDGENSASQVTVHYDGKILNLPVDDEGIVNVSNKLEAQELQTSHGKFFPVDPDEENDLPDYVLQDLNVSEVEGYLRDITSIDRLKELRGLESSGENRTTALQHIDNRIAEVQEQEEVQEAQEQEAQEQEEEEEEEENVEDETDDEDSGENEEENGSETEN